MLLYHISTRTNRESIAAHGLNPDHSSVWGYAAHRGKPYPWTWFWNSLEVAQSHAAPSGFGTDIWEVDASDLPLVSDPHVPDDTRAVATQARVPPTKLRRVSGGT